MAPTVLLLLALTQVAGPKGPDYLSPGSDPTRPRVRPMNDEARAILQEASDASATVAGLVRTLDTYDVVVYVQATINTPNRGVLTYVGYGEPLTYVLARIDLRQGKR